MELLEAPFNLKSNHIFHLISDEVTRESGIPLSDKVFPKWLKWLNEEVEKRKNISL